MISLARKLLLSLLVVASLFGGARAQEPEPADDCVMMFSEVWYGGTSKELCKSWIALNSVWSGTVRSMKFGSNVARATIFENARFNTEKSGRTDSQTVSQVYYPPWVNRNSSMSIIWKSEPAARSMCNNCVRFYQHINYRGNVLEINNGFTGQYWKDFSHHHFNDVMSSLKMGSSVDQISLFEHKNYPLGWYLNFVARNNRNINDLRQWTWKGLNYNDVVSSVLVFY